MAVPYAFGFKSCLNTFLLFFFPPLRQLDVASYALGQNFDSMILINWKINPHRGVKGLIRSKEVNRNCSIFKEKYFFRYIYISNEIRIHFFDSSNKLFKFRLDATIVKDILDSHLLSFSRFNKS